MHGRGGGGPLKQIKRHAEWATELWRKRIEANDKRGGIDNRARRGREAKQRGNSGEGAESADRHFKNGQEKWKSLAGADTMAKLGQKRGKIEGRETKWKK